MYISEYAFLNSLHNLEENIRSLDLLCFILLLVIIFLFLSWFVYINNAIKHRMPIIGKIKYLFTNKKKKKFVFFTTISIAIFLLFCSFFLFRIHYISQSMKYHMTIIVMKINYDGIDSNYLKEMKEFESYEDLIERTKNFYDESDGYDGTINK